VGDLANASLLYSARPAIAVDDADDPALADGVLALSVHEDVTGLFSCEATFGNWGSHAGTVDFLYFDRAVLEFGRRFSVTMGAGDRGGQVFAGRISGLEGRYPQQRPPELLVLAEDRFQDLRMIRRTRSFENATFDDVASQIASDHGLTPDIDADSPTYQVLAQVNQSDLAFLRERARAIDAEIWMDGNMLHAQARSRRRTADATLTFGQALHEFSVAADLAGQRTAVTVTGWDVAGGEGLEEQAGASAIAGESEGTAGPSLLQSAFGDRPERIVHMAPRSADEARALAETHFRRLARAFVRGQGVAEGDARIRVGSRITLRGLGSMFDGAYQVTETRHAFEPVYGFRTHFAVERPWIGQ
jgi:uncharacterized protein